MYAIILALRSQYFSDVVFSTITTSITNVTEHRFLFHYSSTFGEICAAIFPLISTKRAIRCAAANPLSQAFACADDWQGNQNRISFESEVACSLAHTSDYPLHKLPIAEQLVVVAQVDNVEIASTHWLTNRPQKVFVSVQHFHAPFTYEKKKPY